LLDLEFETPPEQAFSELRENEDSVLFYMKRAEYYRGSKMKGGVQEAIRESAGMLFRLIRHCIENKSLPNPETLAP
jgi:hypothetical protein